MLARPWGWLHDMLPQNQFLFLRQKTNYGPPFNRLGVPKNKNGDIISAVAFVYCHNAKVNYWCGLYAESASHTGQSAAAQVSSAASCAWSSGTPSMVPHPSQQPHSRAVTVCQESDLERILKISFKMDVGIQHKSDLVLENVTFHKFKMSGIVMFFLSGIEFFFSSVRNDP